MNTTTICDQDMSNKEEEIQILTDKIRELEFEISEAKRTRKSDKYITAIRNELAAIRNELAAIRNELVELRKKENILLAQTLNLSTSGISTYSSYINIK